MINIRTLKKLGNNDGLTLKKGTPIQYKTGYQVGFDGIATPDTQEAMKSGITTPQTSFISDLIPKKDIAKHLKYGRQSVRESIELLSPPSLTPDTPLLLLCRFTQTALSMTMSLLNKLVMHQMR